MATFGYGKKTFTQSMARFACKMEAYLVKHDASLKHYLPPAVYTCVTSIEPCLITLCQQLNKSAR